MELKHVLLATIALVSAATYIEKVYKHPTLGNGLRILRRECCR